MQENSNAVTPRKRIDLFNFLTEKAPQDFSTKVGDKEFSKEEIIKHICSGTETGEQIIIDLWPNLPKN